MMPDPALHPCRLLLVDDSATFLETLLKVLARYSWIQVVGTALDSRQGLTLATQLHPDIVITDLAMPVLPGLRLLALLRKAAPEAKLVALTLFDEEANGQAALAAGAHAFVSKVRLLEDLVPMLGVLADEKANSPAASDF